MGGAPQNNLSSILWVPQYTRKHKEMGTFARLSSLTANGEGDIVETVQDAE